MEPITIFTTTYNRKTLLYRLFLSIKKQTDHNFIWLIVDDGSTDGTSEFVESFMADTDVDFKIDYIKKKNGGKHTAMKIGFERTLTKYMVEIDDDDELLPDAIETLIKVWQDIEKEDYDNIAEIRALSINENGIVSGQYNSADNRLYFDSNYLKEDWYNNHHLENITSWRMDLVNPLNIFDIEHEWLYPNVKLVSESLFWNRIARVYDTRYLNKPLRLYHSDAEDSITLSRFSKQKCYNYVFSLRVIVNELKIHGWKNPIHLIKYFFEYMSCGKAVNISAFELIRNISAPYNKIICSLICPIGIMIGIYLRKQYSKINI